ncbi:hypothetical protein EDC02_0904 [Micromonospora sp. Llam0]|uniref:hypothetical protein n=1 Tax=Micromonospora sp. Llam0 TaxID=2485143 RepID=UPI000F4AEDDC|nr:hypothetical protein [Micromonospora sp. Llam0]ROO59117.1 hypothetical protein EDC02_0904 [Micromonospora sp. Llam0]
MNIILWVLQWILGAVTLSSFLSMFYLVRRGHARQPIGAAAMATFGLCCGIGVVLPWLTGQARIVTPVAAMVIALVTVFDSLTNPMDASDVAFNTAVLVMAVTVAAGRLHDLSPDTSPTPLGWGFLLGGTALVVFAIWGTQYDVSPAIRRTQALTGLAGVLAGLIAFAGL